jgi:hypothetical protein
MNEEYCEMSGVKLDSPNDIMVSLTQREYKQLIHIKREHERLKRLDDKVNKLNSICEFSEKTSQILLAELDRVCEENKMLNRIFDDARSKIEYLERVYELNRELNL